MTETLDAYDQLYAYTMGRPGFFLQHVVDAGIAQRATAADKPIAVFFAVAGLYLHLECGFTGAQVQQAHRMLGERKRGWPTLRLPPRRGTITAKDVMAVPEGAQRDEAIDRWCQSVWNDFQDSRDTIIGLLQQFTLV